MITRTEPVVKVVSSVAGQLINKSLSDRTVVVNPAVASVETDSTAPVAGGDKVDVQRSNNGEMSAVTAIRTVMLQSQQQPTQLQNECRAEESDGSGVPLTTAITITGVPLEFECDITLVFGEDFFSLVGVMVGATVVGWELFPYCLT